MDILKSFKLIGQDIYINIQGTIEEPLFQANQIGKILDMKNIHESIKDFDEDERVTMLNHTAGGLQNITFLTENGLYRLINRSKKPIARPFQKLICNVIKELRLKGEYKLKDHSENEINKDLLQLIKDNERHNVLIKSLHNQNVIYICKLRKEDGKLLIKVGSSQNIKERISHISNAFENIEVKLIDAVKCNNHIKYEKYLHNLSFFKNFNYPIENKQGIISKETYLVTDEVLNEMVKIINNNVINYDNENLLEIEKVRLEQDKVKLHYEEAKQNNLIAKKEIKNIELELVKHSTTIEQNDELVNKVKQMEETLEIVKQKFDNNNENFNDEVSINSDDDDIDETTIYFSTKKMTYSIKIPYVYQYDPSNLVTPIKIHESPADVERSPELSHLEISPSPLRNASKNNTIYKGYRWYFVKRDEQAPEKIPDTVISKHKEPDIKYIAMIDITKTKILAVYPNQKEAAKARLMKSNSFHRAIQNGTISSGHYWNYFDKCSIEMQNEYLKNNILPDKYVSNCCKKVQQICPKTKVILKTYNSSRDVIRLFKMSNMSLQKYNKSGEIHNGYIWKIIDE